MLHWAWQGVSRSSLKRAMSLASTNPHEMFRRQRLDQWHFPLGSSQAVEMIDNYGTQLMSVQLVANVMNIKI